MRKALLLTGALLLTSVSVASSYPFPYYGYCYTDCSRCVSGHACADGSSCTPIPACANPRSSAKSLF